VRAGISDNDKGYDFIRRAKAHGISVVWIAGPVYLKDAPPATPIPDSPTGRNPGLSYIDQAATQAKFAAIFANLDQYQLKIAGLEFGNELNWLSNGDFPVPGDGRVLGYQDLQDNDPIGRKVARGYLSYLEALKTVRALRDQSVINRDALLISNGLADSGQPGPMPLIHNIRFNTVSISATLQFFKAHGADHIVDAYGIHTYPTAKDPGTASGAALRSQKWAEITSQCGVGQGGKPCWLTEWGFGIDSDTCPIDEEQEAKRMALVSEYRRTLQSSIDAGRLSGVLFFDWGGIVKGKPDRAGIVQCDQPTQSGLLAISPFN